jgi:hypothetical protein
MPTKTTGTSETRWFFARDDGGSKAPILLGYCADNCTGHPTAIEASEHFKQYLLDNYAQYDRRTDRQSPCQICGTATNRFAETPGRMARLCDDHCNREGLEQSIQAIRDFVAPSNYLDAYAEVVLRC